MKESDLYPPVKQWLEEQGFEVFPEVTNDWGRVDVVGVKGDVSIAVELKASLSLDLYSQVRRNENYANQSYAAVPALTTNRMKTRRNRYMFERGQLGILSVERDGVLVDLFCPPTRGTVFRNLATKCFKEYQTQGVQGGHFGGGYLTPKKILLGRAKAYMEEVGRPVSVREIMDNIEMVGTHYSSRESASGVIFSHFVLADHPPSVFHGLAPDWVEIVRPATGRRVFFKIKERVVA